MFRQAVVLLKGNIVLLIIHLSPVEIFSFKNFSIDTCLPVEQPAPIDPEAKDAFNPGMVCLLFL